MEKISQTCQMNADFEQHKWKKKLEKQIPDSLLQHTETSMHVFLCGILAE